MRGLKRYCSPPCSSTERDRQRRRARSPEQREAVREYMREYHQRRAASLDVEARARALVRDREVRRRYYTKRSPEKRAAIYRRATQWRTQRISTNLAALGSLPQQLKAHGITPTHLARRLGMNSESVRNVLAGRGTSQRLLGMARQMLAEPPIPPPVRLSPEEKRARARARDRASAARRRLTVEHLERRREVDREYRARHRKRLLARRRGRARSRTDEERARHNEQKRQRRWASRLRETMAEVVRIVLDGGRA